jgi:hypothetical protein
MSEAARQKGARDCARKGQGWRVLSWACAWRGSGQERGHERLEQNKCEIPGAVQCEPRALVTAAQNGAGITGANVCKGRRFHGRVALKLGAAGAMAAVGWATAAGWVAVAASAVAAGSAAAGWAMAVLAAAAAVLAAGELPRRCFERNATPSLNAVEAALDVAGADRLPLRA